MTERPIPYSPDMVKARRGGLKTQTRRLMRVQPPEWAGYGFAVGRDHYFFDGPPNAPATRHWPDWAKGVSCPFGQPGDRLWTREHWRAHKIYDDKPPRDIPSNQLVLYEADGDSTQFPDSGRFRHGMFMPRWASRGLDEIVSVRAERLQTISASDALQEGLEACWDLPTRQNNPVCWSTAVQLYRELWETINGAGSWDLNPWVWVVEFKVIRP